MASLGVIDTYLTYQFIRRLTANFEDWKAFKTGVIDKDGNIIVPANERSSEQKKSFKLFDLLILNLKKILAKIPGGKSKLATFAAALFLITEDLEDYSEEQLLEKLKEYINRDDLSELYEEVTNSVGGGAIAGINPPAIRTKDTRFAGSKVFDVDFEKYWKSRFGKLPAHRYSRYLGEDELADEIKDYCKRNPKESVILRDSTTGQMLYLRRRK